MAGTTELDDADLRALEQQAKQGPTAGVSPEDAAFLNQPLDINFEGNEFQGTHPEGNYPCRLVKIDVKISQQRTDVMSGEQKGGNRYINADWLIIAGPRKGFHIFDIIMLEGKGLPRFQLLVSKLGMYNKETKRFTGKLADLLNKMAWVKIQHSLEEYPTGSGTKVIRARVAFEGYEAITEHAIPGDVPTNGGAKASVTTPPPAQPQPTAETAAPPQAPPQAPVTVTADAPVTQSAVPQEAVTDGAGGQTAMPPW